MVRDGRYYTERPACSRFDLTLRVRWKTVVDVDSGKQKRRGVLDRKREIVSAIAQGVSWITNPEMNGDSMRFDVRPIDWNCEFTILTSAYNFCDYFAPL